MGLSFSYLKDIKNPQITITMEDIFFKIIDYSKSLSLIFLSNSTIWAKPLNANIAAQAQATISHVLLVLKYEL